MSPTARRALAAAPAGFAVVVLAAAQLAAAGGRVAGSAAPYQGPEAAAVSIERSAARLSARLGELDRGRRVRKAAAAADRAQRRGAAVVAGYPAAGRAAALDELARVGRGIARARRAVTLARRGERRRARRYAGLARRRLAAPLTALRGLCCPPELPLPAAAAPQGTLPAQPAPCAAVAPLPAFRTSGYGTVPIPFDKEPFRRTRPESLEDPVNPDGSLPYYVDGVQHPHPTALENYALALTESYRLTGEPGYLRRAAANADKLLAHAVSYAGGVYLAYTFPFNVFGEPGDHLAPPWFSGMAQGRALIMFRRLFEASGEDRWLRAEDMIYATTFHPRCAGRPWSTFVDGDGYLWFEEYPGARIPTRVLNGHLSALFGYWERARSTGERQARELFDGGATTALHYSEVLRRPGAYSAYSVSRPVQNAFYHGVHIAQLHQMAILTGDDAFERLALAYEADRDAAEGS